MPTMSKEKQQYHRERIRAILIVRPKASITEVKQVLEESAEAPLALDRDYISAQMKKIISERTTRLSLANRNQRVAFVQDKKERIDAMLWSEATNTENSGRERIMALALLFKNELEMLQAEMDAGVFERHLGVIRREVAPLSPEQKTRILEAMIKWGIIKPKKTEHEPTTRSALPD